MRVLYKIDILNFSFNLDEPELNFKVVKKKLSSLSKIFKVEVSTIKESNDMDFLKINKLVGYLQTFEMTTLKNKEYCLECH